MKQEMYYGVVYYSYEELKDAIDRYIVYNNEKRIKQKNILHIIKLISS